MSIKITRCDNCTSANIKELNPETRETSSGALCQISCVCNECGNRFTINSWTKAGKRKGIKY